LGLFVSDWRGNGLREIGHETDEESMNMIPDHWDPPAIDLLEWLPGGKSISFVHKDELYVSQVN
jgi:hypothetical protein